MGPRHLMERSNVRPEAGQSIGELPLAGISARGRTLRKFEARASRPRFRSLRPIDPGGRAGSGWRLHGMQLARIEPVGDRLRRPRDAAHVEAAGPDVVAAGPEYPAGEDPAAAKKKPHIALKTTDAFCPPKPRLLLRTVLTGAERAALGT